jgi:L-alanine-DL-glutamate epimerase-like enolase superfamily enzyme
MATATSERELTIERAAIRFAAPFRISGYLFDSMPSVVATIAEDGKAGRGEAAGVYYLGDDQDRMAAMLEEFRGEIEAGLDRQQLQRSLPPCGARNALDCALWELEAKTAGTSVWSLAGVRKPKPLVTTFTLPAEDPAMLGERVRALDFAKAIKLKLEGAIEVDSERLAVVRSARPDVWLSVDANQGFGADDLDALASLLARHDVAMVEQPLARGSEQALAGWRPGIPVAADESILDLGELREKGELFDIVNIKLDKCGGLTEALSMVRAARMLGLKVMVGNMGGSTLAMAPGFVLGQLCDFVDLDGPYGLAEDPLAGSIYSDGEIFVPEAVWGGIESGARR